MLGVGIAFVVVVVEDAVALPQEPRLRLVDLSADVGKLVVDLAHRDREVALVRQLLRGQQLLGPSAHPAEGFLGHVHGRVTDQAVDLLMRHPLKPRVLLRFRIRRRRHGLLLFLPLGRARARRHGWLQMIWMQSPGDCSGARVVGPPLWIYR